jgi:hypothetical protein
LVVDPAVGERVPLLGVAASRTLGAAKTPKERIVQSAALALDHCFIV